MFKRLWRFLRNIFRSTEPLNFIPPESSTILTPVNEVQEVAWFTRANRLVTECVIDPPIISSSNLSSNNLYIEYKGYVILAHTEKGISERKEMIDLGMTHGFATIEQYKHRYTPHGESDLTEDDVEFLENDPNYAKPELDDNKTYIIERNK